MSNHETITLTAGERQVIHLDDGETYENVMFDQRADGAAATISAMGTNWTIRNVGWRGSFGHQDRALGVADTGGGESVIENVYMGDGVESGIGERRHPMFGLWVAPDHSGTLNIRRTYVEGAHDNGFYCSAPGYNGSGGTVNLTNCYAKDNWVSGFRNAKGTIRNCTAVNSSSGRDGRPLWVWPGDGVDVYNSNFIAGGYAYALDVGRSDGTANLHLENTQYDSGTHSRMNTVGSPNVTDGGGNGTDPADRVPSGCPQSAFEAAEGEWNNGENGDDGETANPDPSDEQWNEPGETLVDWPEYGEESIVVPEDTHQTIEVGTGERFEDVLIDITRPDASATIVARGRDWRIANVAFTGTHDTDAPTAISAAVERGASATIENVYMGDGSDTAHAVHTPERHRGTLHVNDCHISRWDHGVDGRNANGRMQVNRCYVASNATGVALSTEGSDIYHSVFFVPDNAYGVDVYDITDPADLTIENSDFNFIGDAADHDLVRSIDGATATIIFCRFTDGYGPDSTVFTIENPDANPPTSTLPTGVPDDANSVFGRSSVWRRPARRLIHVSNTMVTGADEYGLRVGSDNPRVRTIVENCVIDVDGIGLIADGGEVTVRDCDIRGDEADRRTANGGSIRSVDSRWGADAVIEPPDGIPLSALEASGDRS